MRASVLQTKKLSKSYGEGVHQFFALRNIDLDIKKVNLQLLWVLVVLESLRY